MESTIKIIMTLLILALPLLTRRKATTSPPRRLKPRGGPQGGGAQPTQGNKPAPSLAEWLEDIRQENSADPAGLPSSPRPERAPASQLEAVDDRVLEEQEAEVLVDSQLPSWRTAPTPSELWEEGSDDREAADERANDAGIAARQERRARDRDRAQRATIAVREGSKKEMHSSRQARGAARIRIREGELKRAIMINEILQPPVSLRDEE